MLHSWLARIIVGIVLYGGAMFLVLALCRAASDRRDGLKCLLLALLLCGGLQMQAQDSSPAPASRKAFAAVAALDIAAMSADMALSAHRYSPRASICHESNPLYGRKPSPARYWATGASITVGIDVTAWKLRARGKQWWSAPMIADTMLHTIGVMAGPHEACLR